MSKLPVANKIPTSVSFRDERGNIIDLLQDETIHAATVVTFKQGAVRGNHYHKATWQWNYVMSGTLKLVTQKPGEAVQETILQRGDFAVTVPNEAHTLVALEAAELMVLTKGPRGGKEYESDTFRLEKPLVP